MNTILKLEELAQLGLAIFLFTLLDYSWWWFPALLLVPDIGMLGYLAGPKLGAFGYNLFHHKGIAIGLYLVGYYLGDSALMLCGIILFGHSAMDRILGYGLKYSDSFHRTHLGYVGQKKSN